MNKSKRKFIISPKDLVTDKGLGPAEKIIYLVLTMHADNVTRKCYPSQATIADESGYGRTTVIKAIQNLENLGYIIVDKITKGTKTFNLYTILDKDIVENIYSGSSISEHGHVQNLNTNYTNKNYKQTNISKDMLGASAEQKQKTLLDIQVPQKKKKEKKLSRQEQALVKINSAKQKKIAWDKVTFRDYTYYYIEQHNKMMRKPISFDMYSSVGAIRENFINAFSIPKDRVCDYIDKILEIYSRHPQAWDSLTFGMIQKNNPLMKDLMRKADVELNEPSSKLAYRTFSDNVETDVKDYDPDMIF